MKGSGEAMLCWLVLVLRGSNCDVERWERILI